MARLGGMDELRGRAGRGQRRRDLARDMARFAHPRNDHPAARAQDQLDGPGEAAIQTVRELAHPLQLDRDHAARGIQIVSG
jgi:hypothetical protein